MAPTALLAMADGVQEAEAGGSEDRRGWQRAPAEGPQEIVQGEGSCGARLERRLGCGVPWPGMCSRRGSAGMWSNSSSTAAAAASVLGERGAETGRVARGRRYARAGQMDAGAFPSDGKYRAYTSAFFLKKPAQKAGVASTDVSENWSGIFRSLEIAVAFF